MNTDPVRRFAVIDALNRTAASIAVTFCKLARIQFEAPWAPTRSRC